MDGLQHHPYGEEVTRGDSYPLSGDGRGGRGTVDEEDANEACPLKGLEDVEISAVDVITAKENDANSTSAQPKEQRHKGLRAWFAKQQVKWCIAILVAVVLLAVVLVATLLAFDGAYDFFQDKTPRLMRLVPKPNRPDNILFMRYGAEARRDKNGWQPLTDQLDNLLSGYESTGGVSMGGRRNVTECFGAFPPEGYSCFFDTVLINPECSARNNYGYEEGSPCVFLQFNNFSDWKPEAYNTRDLETMDHLPAELRATYKPNVVFLDCKGETFIDQEHIGPIEYSPERGFKINFFPFTGQPDYMPPLVAVRFKKPKIGLAISVICKLWAKNINHTEYTVPSGSLHFTLLIE